MLAKFVENHGAANAEAKNGDKSDDLDCSGTDVQRFAEQGGEREDNSYDVQPEWKVNISGDFAIAEPQLKHQGNRAHGGDHNHRDRTQEISPIRTRYHESERANQES